MNRDEGKEPELSANAALLVGLARRSLGEMSHQQRTRGLLRVAERTASRRALRLSPLPAVALSIAVAAAGFVAVERWQRSAPSDLLSYEVEGGVASQDGSLQADAASRPKLRFSDGTEVELAEGARAHVASVTGQGARVALDRGEVRAHVVHRSEAQWLFDAGPFVVTVTGTAFALAWAPEDGRLDLRLENGAVTVSGPPSGEPIAMRAGQWLTVRLRTGEVLLRELGAQKGAEAAPSSAPPPSDGAELPGAPPPDGAELPGAPPPDGAELPGAPPEGEPPAAPRAEAAAAPKRDWAGQLAAGQLDAIVDEAQRRGLDQTLAASSSAELSALADAARYTRRGDVARRALLAQRRRFPATQRAREAAFLLGRLAETQEGGAAALPWFETYLKEAPQGAYASEALGRKMEIVRRLHGDAQAEIVAREYLRRFPGGTYAQAARTLARTP
ncbi:FecR domain-containing protein [Sorangium sp. So ce542]|uniref:FecR domain-containing protein n=1 Tax=Sorangium sp. So ce542 TaxID=3133316 RepID=UPI003F5D7E9A